MGRALWLVRVAGREVHGLQPDTLLSRKLPPAALQFLVAEYRPASPVPLERKDA